MSVVCGEGRVVKSMSDCRVHGGVNSLDWKKRVQNVMQWGPSTMKDQDTRTPNIGIIILSAILASVLFNFVTIALTWRYSLFGFIPLVLVYGCLSFGWYPWRTDLKKGMSIGIILGSIMVLYEFFGKSNHFRPWEW